ncbi:MAG: hypothetical protein LBK22_06075 [Tannerella sp.]|jgi:hypothetical protein|nr:hypothetical protein [Tannerella sp.]
MHINGKEMNALTGNKVFPLIFRSIDMDALTGNAYPGLSALGGGSHRISANHPENPLIP